MSSFFDAFAKLNTPEEPLPTITDNDPEYQDILAAVSRQADEELYAAGVPVQIGYTEIHEDAMQQILWEKYRLHWTPKGRKSG